MSRQDVDPTEPPQFDNWSWADHKRIMGDAKLPGMAYKPMWWVPKGDRRRLQAYTLLQAYIDNSARFFLTTADETRRQNHREYGDAALIVTQTLAALIGDDQTIVVEDADKFDPELVAVTRPVPDPEDVDVDDEDERDEPEGPTAEELALNARYRQAAERQDQLEQWADAERLVLKIFEVERDAIGLSDGVYVIGRSPEKGRPHVQVFDPATYFPDLNSRSHSDDYPRRVWIAWEEEDEDADPNDIRPGSHARKLRRITYELKPIEPPRDERGFYYPQNRDGGGIVEPKNARWNSETQAWEREYPWNDVPSKWTCYMTDGIYTLPDNVTTLKNLAEAKQVSYLESEDGIPVRNLDLECDFIPVVHIPNGVAVKAHFGRSVLATCLQILDDLQAADTDLSAGAATTGTPGVVLIGGAGRENPKRFGPGAVFTVPEGGDAKMLETANGLAALIAVIEFLLKRLSVNSRVPEAVLGRIDPAKVASGILFALAQGPLSAMTKEMRLVRNEKYPLLLKMAQRFMQQMKGPDGNPLIPAGRAQILNASVQFGSYLPSDKDAVASLVAKLLDAGAISLETGVSMLMGAGLPIEDAAKEVARIRKTDYESLLQLLELTGNLDEITRITGVDSVKPEPAPEVPGAPGAGRPNLNPDQPDEGGGTTTEVPQPVL